MSKLKDKLALVTGGTSGYGKATAATLAAEGARVIIASRNEADLKATQKEIKCADYIRLDVTQSEEWLKAKDYIFEKYGRLDILVNNAGAGLSIKDTVDQEFEMIDAIIKLNLNSVIYGSKVFGKLMKEQNEGTIINISSVCATHCWPGFNAYAAAKAGVLNFSKSLYVELQPNNVRVTCLIPAAANTGFAKSSGITTDKLLMTAQDVADTVLFICKLPQTAVVEDITLWGIDQSVVPL